MKPETKEEVTAARIVLNCAPTIFVYYSKLGVNFQAVHDMFIDPKRRDKTLIAKTG
jgi:hypothetical protein